MAVSKLEFEDCLRITQDLSVFIDFRKDLPGMVFCADDYSFWFFERPLISFIDGLVELVFASGENFSSDVFVRFGGTLESTCFLLDGSEVEGEVGFINEGFRDFFSGEVDYPMVIGDLDFDWLAFESAHEEFGVLAIRSKNYGLSFFDALQRNFISSTDFQQLADRNELMGKMIAAFHSYF